MFSRIIALVEEAESSKAYWKINWIKVGGVADTVVFLDFCIAVVYLLTKDVKLVIALLIFTSPARLKLATPLVTISAIARAAKEYL